MGVDPESTSDEIREAYLARVRIIHPDRFDMQRQLQDWKNANEMLAELNEAYSVLRDEQRREEYDQLRANRHKQQKTSPPPNKTQSSPSVFEHNEIKQGQATFSNLPKQTQERLLKRQDDLNENQFQVKLTSIGWNYVFIPILLCWFWYLFTDATGVKWEDSTIYWYAGITLFCGILIARNINTIFLYLSSTLKPYFYITPIYFIKTSYDIVTYRPIWTLKDIAITHNHKNGIYQNSTVILKFEGHEEILSLSSKELVESILRRIKDFDSNLRTAFTSCNYAYFEANDDFSLVAQAGIQKNVSISKKLPILIYTLSILLSAVGLFVAIDSNNSYYQQRLVAQQSVFSNTFKPPTTESDVSFSLQEKPLPRSGAIKRFTNEEHIAPLEIKAAQGSHYLLKLVDTYTNLQVLTVFVRSGTTVNIEVPLGTYDVRYASGESWYGEKYRFGPDTAYSKADKTFTFERVGNQVSGFTITLYKVQNGNLQTSTIKPEEF